MNSAKIYNPSAQFIQAKNNSHFLKLTSGVLVFLFLVAPIAPVFADDATLLADAVAPDTSSQDATPPAVDVPPSKPISPDDKKLQPTDQTLKNQNQQAATLGVGAPGDLTNSATTKSGFTPDIDNTTGALVYKYSVSVPPGRTQTTTPDVALVYNSANATTDSVVGSGWSINIPSIERINKKGSDTLYSNDIYSSSLSGELTKLNSTDYVAKVEKGDFLVYTKQTNGWLVTDKNGTKYTFGLNAQARQDNPSDSTKIFKWMLEEVRDTNGNYISYIYYKDAGQIYPSQIVYTGNGSTAGVLEVNFDRSVRSNAPALFSTGFSVQSNYRITEIRTEVNNVWAHKYTLAYTTGDNGSGSFLDTIVESGQDDSSTTTTLPAVNFDYQTTTSPGWTYNESLNLPIQFTYSGALDTGLRIVDINGDGLPDLICHNLKTAGNCPNGSPKIYLNDGSGGWTNVSSTWLFPFIPGSSTVREAFLDSDLLDTGLRVFDINGDNLPDLVKNADGISSIYLNNGSGWTYNSSLSVPLSFIYAGHTDVGTRVADINGDGLPDLLCHNLKTPSQCPDGSPKVYLNDGSGGWTNVSSTWLFPFIPDSSIVREAFLDANLLDTGTRLVDINGDGLSDLVDGTENGSAVYLNNGSGWTYDSSLSTPLPFANRRRDPGTRVADINGDGLPDLLCHTTNNVSGAGFCSDGYPKVHINNNPGWTNVSSTWLFPYLPDSSTTREAFLDYYFKDTGLRIFDLNGDGLPDLVRSSDAGTAIYLNNSNTASNMLTKITYSQGGNTTISYKTTPMYKDGSNNILNPSLPLGVEIVSQVINNDGSGNINSHTYSYEGGKYYFNTFLDRKFAGFAKVTDTDSAGNVTKTFYHQGDASDSVHGEYQDDISKAGEVYRTEVYDNANHLYNKIINKWDKYNLGVGRDFVKLAQIVVSTYDGDSTHKDKAEAYTYDSTYGNMTQKVTYEERGQPPFFTNHSNSLAFNYFHLYI